MLQVLSPVECNGWTLDNERGLAINWMSGLPAPDVVLEWLSCRCKTQCVLPSCTCMQNGLSCTNACALQDCKNTTISEEQFQMESDSEDDDILVVDD